MRYKLYSRLKDGRFKGLIRQTPVLLLLLAVPTLFTHAKINWYLPQSNPGHYLINATKMKVAQTSATFDDKPLPTCPRFFVSVQPPVGTFLEEHQEASIPWQRLVSLLFRRSPPASV